MLDPVRLDSLSREIASCVHSEQDLLNGLRKDVRGLRSSVRRIHPHAATSISLVGTDGGDNRVQFDPFMVQIVRVVDSANNQYCLEAVTPRTGLSVIRDRHVGPETALGRMISRLGMGDIHGVSPMFPRPPIDPKIGWVKVYREVTEWAVLLDLVTERQFATDTLIVHDGFLRSKVFAGYGFISFRDSLLEAILAQYRNNRRRIYVVGIAKRSKVLQAYQLSMALEGVLRTAYPAYLEVPRELESNIYKWDEYARGGEAEGEGGEGNKFVAGRLFFAKFGSSPYDPIWAIDLLESQVDEAPQIFGYLLSDALVGFPIPFYPLCLQRAHENAALGGFDMQILQDRICAAIKESVGTKATIIDDFIFQSGDPSAPRYEAY